MSKFANKNEHFNQRNTDENINFNCTVHRRIRPLCRRVLLTGRGLQVWCVMCGRSQVHGRELAEKGEECASSSGGLHPCACAEGCVRLSNGCHTWPIVASHGAHWEWLQHKPSRQACRV